MKCLAVIVGGFLCLITLWRGGLAWGSDKVILRDVSALTLHQGRMTTGRRSSPVPQLKCIGGSAGCYKFVPQTVQCRNVGYDGDEVQWECKCDMDDSYRFGKVQVTCEGYDYPDDPYILKGSCGLEYTVDYTEAGKSRNQGSYYVASNKDDSGGGWIFFLILVFAIVFLICKMGGANSDSPSTRSDRYQSRYRSSGHDSGHANPPPYGFKPEYTQGGEPTAPPPPPTYADATRNNHYTDATRANHYAGSTRTSTPGGFWTGLGLGGIGGYLFGNRNRNSYHSYGSGWNNGGWGNSWGNRGRWGSGGWGNTWGSHDGSSWGSSHTTYRRSTGSSSSGTSRTASGYGGTSRR